MPLEEGTVVVSREEAGFLALRPPRDREPRCGRLVTRLLLALLAERERHAVEERGFDRREHVRLVLRGVAAARDEAHALPLDDPRVVPRPQHVAPGARGEGHELVEPEAPVAAHARVGREAGGVPVDERLHDRRAEPFAEVERGVRQPEPVARLARGDHGCGRAADALGARPRRVEPQAQRHPDRVRRRPEQRDGAVDAAAHGDRNPAGVGSGREDRADRIRERVRGEDVARHRRGLEEGEPGERALEARSVSVDDPVAVDEQPHEAVLVAAGGIADQLEGRHGVRLARVRAGIYRRRARDAGEAPHADAFLDQPPPGAPPCPDDTVSVIS